MMMKRVLTTLLASAFLSAPLAGASENETIFLPAQGKLVIPHLRLGNEIYFVILNRFANGTYNFALDGATVFKITPQAGDSWATAAQVVGDWVVPDLPGVRLGIFANGNYSIVTPAEDGCPAGTETGTWTLDSRTGVFFPVAVTDGNADCGLSHPDGAARVKRVGSNLQLIIKEVENGVQVSSEITLTPG